ncbi:MAG: hypothetical protein Ta2E_06630 [Mycoplasmoidaceae bacterium]|nr:MAG: hypothetical protein Ta2E_06630 [Mycoplasmoidaceae bacterium]
MKLANKNDILDPVSNWGRVKDDFSASVDKLAQKIKKEAKIDLTANRHNSNEIKRIEKSIKSNKKIKSILSIFIIVVIVGIIMIKLLTSIQDQMFFTIIGFGAALIIGFLIAVFILDKIGKKLHKSRKTLIDIGYKQMADVNRRLHSEEIKNFINNACDDWLVLDDFLSTKNAEIWSKYIKFDDNTCCFCYVTGTLSSSPIHVIRTKNFKMIQKVYTGTSTVSVGFGANQRTVSRTETYTHPAPDYSFQNKVYFMNNSGRGLKCSVGTTVKKDKKVTLMENNSFNKLFNYTLNDHTQFSLLFTPLAQENMVKLNKECTDFVFQKNDELTTIISSKDLNIDINTYSTHFRHYDYEQFFDNLKHKTVELLRAIYFLISPLLCIPVYQHFPWKNTLSNKKNTCLTSDQLLQTVLQSFFDKKNLVEPSTTTDFMIQTKISSKTKGLDVAEITTKSFKGVNKTINVRGTTIHYIDYHPLSRSLYAVSYFNSKRIPEREVTEEESAKIKKLDDSFLQAYILDDFIFFIFDKKNTLALANVKKYASILSSV